MIFSLTRGPGPLKELDVPKEPIRRVVINSNAANHSQLQNIIQTEVFSTTNVKTLKVGERHLGNLILFRKIEELVQKTLQARPLSTGH